MQEKSKKVSVFSIMGIVLCVIFGVMLILNLTIIIKGVVDPDTPPSVFGVTPLVVKTGSMSVWNEGDKALGEAAHKVYIADIDGLSEEQVSQMKNGDTFYSFEEEFRIENVYLGKIFEDAFGKYVKSHRVYDSHIEIGDMIFVKKIEPAKLEVGDVVAFKDNEGTVTTHRIIKIFFENGEMMFRTKGDSNDAMDASPIEADKIIGVYKTRIAGVGDFAFFMQKPLGMIVFIGVPLCAFIVYDIIRRQRSANKATANDAELKKKQADLDKKTAEMEAELERLRKLAGEKASSENEPEDKN